jgi:opacity protein-like surface antigen
MRNHPRHRATLFVLLTCALTFPLAAEAQRIDGGMSGGGKGFLFGRPRGSITLRGGFAQPSARSDVFNDATQFLTLSRGDFAGGLVGADLGVAVTERLEVQFGIGASVRKVGSESRDFEGTDDLPILQTTIFRRVPVTAGLKYNLKAPGRSLGQLAWVPSRWTPFVAAGGGMMYYSYKQDGEFVDFRDLEIFGESLESKGWGTAAYGAAGIDFSLTPHVGLTTQARYDHARGAMSQDFENFNRIDLSGISATVGINFRF